MSPYRVVPPTPAPRRRPTFADRIRSRVTRWRRRRAWTRWQETAAALDRAFWAWHGAGFMSLPLFEVYSAALDTEERARRMAFAADR